MTIAALLCFVVEAGAERAIVRRGRRPAEPAARRAAVERSRPAAAEATAAASIEATAATGAAIEPATTATATAGPAIEATGTSVTTATGTPIVRFTNRDATTVELDVVELLYRLRRVRVLDELDESEAARSTGIPIGDHSRHRHLTTTLFEVSSKEVVRRAVREIPDEDSLPHRCSTPAGSTERCSQPKQKRTRPRTARQWGDGPRLAWWREARGQSG
jgi:hypothetical protein